MSNNFSRFGGNMAGEKENYSFYLELLEKGLTEEAEWYSKFNQEYDGLERGEYTIIPPKEGKAHYNAHRSSVSSYKKKLEYNSKAEVDPVNDMIDNIDKKYYLSKQKDDTKLKDVKPILQFISEMPGVTFTDDEYWQVKKIVWDKYGLLVDDVCLHYINRELAEKRMSIIHERDGGTTLDDIDRDTFETEWGQQERMPSKKKIAGGSNKTKNIRKKGDMDEYKRKKVEERDTYGGPIGREACKLYTENQNRDWTKNGK